MRFIYNETYDFEQAVRTVPLKIVLQIAPWIVFLLAILMVSRIRYAHVVDRVFSKETSFRYTMAFIVSFFVILIEPELSLCLIFFLYLISGPLNMLRVKIAGFVTESEPEPS